MFLSFICANCPDGTSGPKCEDLIDECEVNNVKCLNGGKPVDGVGKCTCECLDGYEGAVCQINTDDCKELFGTHWTIFIQVKKLNIIANWVL